MKHYWFEVVVRRNGELDVTAFDEGLSYDPHHDGAAMMVTERYFSEDEARAAAVTHEDASFQNKIWEAHCPTELKSPRNITGGLDIHFIGKAELDAFGKPIRPTLLSNDAETPDERSSHYPQSVGDIFGELPKVIRLQ